MKISALVFCTSSYNNLAVFSVQKNWTSKHGVHNTLKVSKSNSWWVKLNKSDTAASLFLCWDHPWCAERQMPVRLEKRYYLEALSWSLASYSAHLYWNHNHVSVVHCCYSIRQVLYTDFFIHSAMQSSVGSLLAKIAVQQKRDLLQFSLCPSSLTERPQK